MNKRLLALALTAACTLSSCASLLDRSHVSSSPHRDFSVAEDTSILRVENYQALVNALLYLVNQHNATGTIRLYNYTGDVETDLKSACDEVTTIDPLGVFCVDSISYDSTRILTYYEVDVQINYSRSAQAISSIQSVSGLSGLRNAFLQAITATQPQSIIRVSYFSSEQSTVESLFWQTLYSTPRLVLTPPELTLSLYPNTGSQRIVELTMAWKDSPVAFSQYSKVLDTAVNKILQAIQPENMTLDTLVAQVAQRIVPQPQGARTALAALSGEPTSDLGLLLGLEAVLQGAELEANMVIGQHQEEPSPWLIVSTPQGYRHLLPQVLYPNQPLILYTDTDLKNMGYTWVSSLYPACR